MERNRSDKLKIKGRWQVKRVFTAIISISASRTVTPVVIAFYMMLYIVLAFGTDEVLVTLMELIRKSILLQFVFLLVPLNCVARIIKEVLAYNNRRKIFAGDCRDIQDGYFPEEVVLEGVVKCDSVRELLSSSGYKINCLNDRLIALQGISLAPVRIIGFVATALLFIGVLLSLTTRQVRREAIIEGEQLPAVMGNGTVDRITLKDTSGIFLSKTLSIDATFEGRTSHFKLYPPSFFRNSFVYMRYLGMAPLVTFKAPDLSAPVSSYLILMLYPPGRNDTAEIPDTDYKVLMSLDSPLDGSDPYEKADGIFRFTIMKGKEALHSGQAMVGQAYRYGGYEISFTDPRRVVMADLVVDRGITLVWWGGVLIVVSSLFRVVIGVFSPRREMLFRVEGGNLHCRSFAEGGFAGHAGVFHEAVDILHLMTDNPG